MGSNLLVRHQTHRQPPSDVVAVGTSVASDDRYFSTSVRGPVIPFNAFTCRHLYLHGTCWNAIWRSGAQCWLEGVLLVASLRFDSQFQVLCILFPCICNSIYLCRAEGIAAKLEWATEQCTPETSEYRCRSQGLWLAHQPCRHRKRHQIFTVIGGSAPDANQQIRKTISRGLALFDGIAQGNGIHLFKG